MVRAAVSSQVAGRSAECVAESNPRPRLWSYWDYDRSDDVAMQLIDISSCVGDPSRTKYIRVAVLLGRYSVVTLCTGIVPEGALTPHALSLHKSRMMDGACSIILGTSQVCRSAPNSGTQLHSTDIRRTLTPDAARRAVCEFGTRRGLP
jgi:hypothetical protein